MEDVAHVTLAGPAGSGANAPNVGADRQQAAHVRVSKIRGTILGVPRIRIIIFWWSILGSPYFEKLPFVGGEC